MSLPSPSSPLSYSTATPPAGWIVLDKSEGMSSAQAVNRVKRLFSIKKAGHAGTLDPLASGILPIAFGRATKTIPYMVDTSKSYRFTVSWGQATSTDDREGPVVASSDIRPDSEAITAILPRFTGTIMQTPPNFSAIKQNGRRAYDLARQGETVSLPERPIDIQDITLEEHTGDTSTFQVTCGKGTYIRSLARDMGELLGCYGHIARLRRTAVGKFTEKNAISLDKLEEVVHNNALFGLVLSVDTVLDDIPALHITEAQAERLQHGGHVHHVSAEPVSSPSHTQYRVYVGERFIALAGYEDNVITPNKVFM